jgi:hypothetical protein
MKLASVVTTAALAMALFGCGGGGSTTITQQAAGGRAVVVNVTSPTDGAVIAQGSVPVRGTVDPPNATVEIEGHAVAAGNGTFVGTAKLGNGRTTIEVTAGAPNETPGSASVTVTRPSTSQPKASGGGGSGGGTAPSGGGGTVPTPESSGGSCGNGTVAGPDTSCPFAVNVRSAYERNGPGTVTVYSPVTNRTYYMSCSDTGARVTCTGANNASVYFP